jgi:hypothetical protein
MNLDFTDPNLLIDDSAFPESSDKHRMGLKSLEFPKPLQNYLFLQTGGTEIQNASIQLEGNSITIKAFVLEQYPKQAREAFVLANKTKHRHIRYKQDGENDYLWCDWASPNRIHPDGKIERQRYLSSAKYLPSLLQKYGEIVVQSGKEKRFANFNKNYRIQNLWIEYYLLGETEALVELGFNHPRQNQYRPGKIAAKRHNLIQDIWVQAKVYKNPICKWILSFDSPDIVWFMWEIIDICKQWNRIPKNGHQFYKSEKERINRLKHHEGKGVSLIYSEETENFMSLDQALDFTILRLLQTGKEPDHHQEYLQACTGQANDARKKPKAKSTKGFSS